MAAACILNAQYTFAWSAANFYRTELLMGVGQSFAFIGLVSTIVLQAIFSGGLSKPQDALTFSAFFHIIRLLGGQVGWHLMGHYIAVRERITEPARPARTRRQLAGRGFHSANDRGALRQISGGCSPRAALLG
jgi:hypothetical protein